MKKNDLGFRVNAGLKNTCILEPPQVVLFSFSSLISHCNSFERVVELVKSTAECWTTDFQTQTHLTPPGKLAQCDCAIILKPLSDVWSMGDWMDDFSAAALTVLLLVLCPLHNVLQGADWMMKCTLDFGIGSSSILPSNDGFLFNITDSGTPLWTSLHFFTLLQAKHNHTTKSLEIQVHQVNRCVWLCCVTVQWRQAKLPWWWKVLWNGDITDSHGRFYNRSNTTWRSTLSSSLHPPSLPHFNQKFGSCQTGNATCVSHPLFPPWGIITHKKTTVSTNSATLSTIFETVTVPPSSFSWAIYLWRTSSTNFETRPPPFAIWKIFARPFPLIMQSLPLNFEKPCNQTFWKSLFFHLCFFSFKSVSFGCLWVMGKHWNDDESSMNNEAMVCSRWLFIFSWKRLFLCKWEKQTFQNVLILHL